MSGKKRSGLGDLMFLAVVLVAILAAYSKMKG